MKTQLARVVIQSLLMKKQKIIPKNFLWGASTSSHQVEGNNHNQWTVWELENALRLAKHAEKNRNPASIDKSQLNNWQDIKKQATNPENYISGSGVEHYKRYKEDIKIAKDLNLNSLRFGIEWSRIEPNEGQWNEKQWQHYRDYINEIIEQGLEPILNIWHWTMPVWFYEKGGFEKAKNVQYFLRFVEKMCQELPLDRLKYIITLNEPNVYTTFSYIIGDWPPNQKSQLQGAKVYLNLVKSHKRAYKIIKKHHSHLQIGIAAQLANVQSKRPRNLVDVTATHLMRYAWNWWFLNRIKNYQDFVGVNYYFTDYYEWLSMDLLRQGKLMPERKNPTFPMSDIGWYMEPEGLYSLTVRVWAHYKKPIMITENGLADMHDAYRRWWIEQTIVALQRSMSEGIDIVGYMHWSLLDNFEWAEGWWPKFGLVEVDRQNNMKRTIRPSAKYFAEQIQSFKD